LSEREVDTRGLLCPLPVIRTQNAVEQLAPGDTLIVLASDPGALHDIPAWCRVHGHEVVAMQREGNRISITVKVGGA
jgi:tRNA 2-thiouridine synthesizing protein A